MARQVRDGANYVICSPPRPSPPLSPTSPSPLRNNKPSLALLAISLARRWARERWVKVGGFQISADVVHFLSLWPDDAALLRELEERSITPQARMKWAALEKVETERKERLWAAMAECKAEKSARGRERKVRRPAGRRAPWEGAASSSDAEDSEDEQQSSPAPEALYAEDLLSPLRPPSASDASWELDALRAKPFTEDTPGVYLLVYSGSCYTGQGVRKPARARRGQPAERGGLEARLEQHLSPACRAGKQSKHYKLTRLKPERLSPQLIGGSFESYLVIYRSSFELLAEGAPSERTQQRQRTQTLAAPGHNERNAERGKISMIEYITIVLTRGIGGQEWAEHWRAWTGEDWIEAPVPLNVCCGLEVT